MQISGHTKVFGILADPIAHVRTPQVFNAFFQAHGIDAVLVPFHVAPADLPSVWEGLRGLKSLAGLIVTVPHKPTAATLCNRLEPAARLIGASNTIRHEADGTFTGTMFDGIGFVAGLRAQGHEPAGKRAVMAGAGGAGSAVAFALAEAGVASLTIVNRSRAKAEALAARIAAAFPGVPVAAGDGDLAGVDIVVNTTSLGMKPDDPLPLDLANLEPHAVVAEIIMKPEETAILAASRARGNAIHHGRHMLDQQIRLMAEFMGVGG